MSGAPAPAERFLITLSLGPVQSLIGAARRTRDLWCGSWLLSEAARAAGRVLHQAQPGCLIFPCPDNPDSDLLPQNQPVEVAPVEVANVANVLRAAVAFETPQEVQALCEQAKRAAADRLVDLGEKARAGLKFHLRETVWQAQIGDILETFAAWVSLADCGNGYAEASRRLGGALAARKATRDFQACQPLSSADAGLPKSSLDGALETVLPRPLSDESRRQLRLSKLRLSRGEQLDALGIIKRLAGDAEQFTSYMRVAADPWVERLSEEQQRRLRDAWEPLVSMELATRTGGNANIYRAVPYDGSLLYDFRLRNALAQDDLSVEHRKALEHLRACIEAIAVEQTTAGQVAGAPVAYAAILKADGDHMGRLLACAKSADEARRISRALHGFASEVRGIVRCHRGHAIYAGGDDVLALLPLASAVDCARALADKFKEALDEIAGDMKVPAAERPTLSAGLGIGHVMEPMAALRERAERAEKAAKGDATITPRNALAIRLGIRAGAEPGWRAQWSDQGAFDALRQFIEAYRQRQLPARAAYDMRAIDRRLAWLRSDCSDPANSMRAAEVHRMLERARRPGGEKRIPHGLQELLRACAGKQPLYRLADTLIIARWLAARTAADVGERV
ncbi:MAG: type III-B CRISPR-associated protein Cas10/Cmr2 [Gammaproteobacteria bacterium]|nr:type III-B CRISPR-associated protein Cas10/Cmr2 [Gammaproteobacteria bacterium]